MTKRNDDSSRDPELERLLAACRSENPTEGELDGWKLAVRAERASLARPPEKEVPRSSTNVLRFAIRRAIQVGVAASLGFLVGAYVIERRFDEGQSMLFSQTEPSAAASHRPDADENREIVRERIE